MAGGGIGGAGGELDGGRGVPGDGSGLFALLTVFLL